MTRKKKGRRRKHVPIRTCIGCDQSQPKRALLRIIALADGGLVVDPTGKQSGRGAYLCHNPACWDKVLSPGDKNLSNALRRAVSDDEKTSLREYQEQASKGEILAL
jgi:predicted RNA-binding protein YlxR (DUF448 family)